jgi:prolyl-tRNA synthetase
MNIIYKTSTQTENNTEDNDIVIRSTSETVIYHYVKMD